MWFAAVAGLGALAVRALGRPVLPWESAAFAIFAVGWGAEFLRFLTRGTSARATAIISVLALAAGASAASA